ncbi:MAG: PH domain-containing protein [Propionibacteriaceae bacterium]|nr:PH domain-containing protein [Propionibacteriaceae bacterium]
MTGRTASGTPTLPATYGTRTLLIWAIVLSLAIIAGAAIGWLALDPHIRERFNWFQLSTLIIIGGVLIGIMMGLGLSNVVANETGLKIRNGFVVRRFRWDEIAEIQYRHGDPWAYLVPAGTEHDPVRRQMIGIQTADGDRAHRAVAELRALHAQFTGRG